MVDAYEAGYEVVLGGTPPDIFEAGYEVVLADVVSQPAWHPIYIYDESFGYMPCFPPALLDEYPPR